MKHIPALLVKLAFVLAITAIVLMAATGATFSDVLLTGIILTVALYALGDLVIFPSWGNGTAVVADAGLAFLLVWLAPFYTELSMVPWTSALLVGALIGVAEYFFHNWLQSAVLPGPPVGGNEGGNS